MKSAILIAATFVVLTCIASISALNEVRSSILNLNQTEVTLDGFSFSGLYYDIDENVSSEKFVFRFSDIDSECSKATLGGKPNNDGHRGVEYISIAKPTDFEFEPWGQFMTIRFLGTSYFAAYNDAEDLEEDMTCICPRSENDNLLADEQVSFILIDSDDEHVVTTDRPLALREGYELSIKNIDPNGERISVELYKDGDVVDLSVISPSDGDADPSEGTYKYKTTLGEARDIVTIAVHFKGVFSSSETYNAIVDGIFQISDTPVSFSLKSKHDKMAVRNVDPVAMIITMDNKDEPIDITADKEILLMDEIYIYTADQDEVRTGNPLRYFVYRDV
jgi:S-layer protein (TIGR01567 family)